VCVCGVGVAMAGVGESGLPIVGHAGERSLLDIRARLTLAVGIETNVLRFKSVCDGLQQTKHCRVTRMFEAKI